MVEAPRWAAVVVNYESGPLLAACVESLLADGSAGEPEVVVVDNGSRDGSVAALRRARPMVTVLDVGENLGYAKAANRGIAATRAAIVAVCNPDLEVEPGTAATIVARFDREPDLAAVGPVLRNPDGSQYPSARSVPGPAVAVGHALFGRILPGNRFTRRYRQLDVDPNVARDVDWVSGAMLFLRRAALASVGGWDERYFMYMEDVDLCWRLHRLGWRIAYEPGGSVTHVQGASTDRHPYRMIVEHHRSVYRFAAQRWRGARRWLLPAAAVFLTGRAAIDLVVRAVAPRSEAPRVSG
jgi:N-acetylglucosaminyl-diphospho-decaprenol L-rhamnosyltransferase